MPRDSEKRRPEVGPSKDSSTRESADRLAPAEPSLESARERLLKRRARRVERASRRDGEPAPAAAAEAAPARRPKARGVDARTVDRAGEQTEREPGARRAPRKGGAREPNDPSTEERRSSRARGGASLPERSSPTDRPEPSVYDVSFPPEAMDEAALKVVRRLTKAGYEAYLVGGCVRDLLVGARPKDFDVATSARPEEVRSLLKNSRIIGRRFRLVHVLFPAGHVIETATFRRPPAESEQPSDDLLIRSDNVFGEAHEDAYRRDFTINGLFFDVEQNRILDWVGGMKHIRGRVVHTIGQPVVRFREDPVRMLRAIKFAARIDFGISPEVYDALVQCRGDLAMAARPRLSEEVLRLMRGGASQRSVWLLWETGLLDVLLPELSVFLADGDADERVFSTLRAVDRATKESRAPLDDVVLWAALLLEPLLDATDGAADRVKAGQDFLEPVVERLNLPRRISEAVCRIGAIVPRLVSGKQNRLKKNPLLQQAEFVLSLRGHTEGRPSAGKLRFAGR